MGPARYRGVEPGPRRETGARPPIAALYRNGVHPVYRVQTQSGRGISATGNHPFLTPRGYVELDDLGPGCEVAMQWGREIYWDRIARITAVGEEETFDLTVEPHHNFVADGFVVHNSHAAAFARTTYETVWLKNRFPGAVLLRPAQQPADGFLPAGGAGRGCQAPRGQGAAR